MHFYAQVVFNVFCFQGAAALLWRVKNTPPRGNESILALLKGRVKHM